ncbi:hypothetical protein Cgig2_021081 [Carnegiea gigantea]|uniref:Uncharacterized protein n=1 Tax=Carnegiea gigantea TaxID=171969 RepID=A0A9Q1GN28_9CARY|nr:hypothetical protein Cgig2_021081 [Carnegiea gigantea]
MVESLVELEYPDHQTSEKDSKTKDFTLILEPQMPLPLNRSHSQASCQKVTPLRRPVPAPVVWSKNAYPTEISTSELFWATFHTGRASTCGPTAACTKENGRRAKPMEKASSHGHRGLTYEGEFKSGRMEVFIMFTGAVGTIRSGLGPVRSRPNLDRSDPRSTNLLQFGRLVYI